MPTATPDNVGLRHSADSKIAAAPPVPNRSYLFFVGVFLLCMAGLMLQIGQTRILSVISFYHLAFFAISMAMFGMSAGAIFIYVRSDIFEVSDLGRNLSRLCVAFSWAIVGCVLLELTTVISTPHSLTLFVIWLKLIVLLFVPFCFAGMAISIALTQSPFRVGLVYGADLVGAAAGCLAMLALLQFVDAISAMLIVAALAAVAAWCFEMSGVDRRGPEPAASTVTGPLRPVWTVLVLLAIIVINLAASPYGLKIVLAKDRLLTPEFERWNSYSHIGISQSRSLQPFLWGRSQVAPNAAAEQRLLLIDAEAGTPMYKFNGDLKTVDFLAYDITTLAYRIRNQGRSAVIGVGGGRDLLSAHYFGFRDITGVELNPTFVEWLTGQFRSYAGVADLPGVRFQVDEARSWFARSIEKFNLIQMSLIDTWAATGAGAFSLSENGLYTTTAWQRFMDRLTPDGVFTVSRWKSPTNIDETGRVFSLALAALYEMGASNPSKHVFLAASDTLSTMIVSKAPLTTIDIQTLHSECVRLGFAVLASPTTPAASPILQLIASAPSAESLFTLGSPGLMDLTPPTDERPFFFNQLKLGNPVEMIRAARSQGSGVIQGNLYATFSLFLIIGLSALLVAVVVLYPARHSIKQVSVPLTVFGTSYFMLLGLGFMLIEIGLIQRMSVFIGHPVYSMAIVLFGIILSTGLGSILSDRVSLNSASRVSVWGAALVSTVVIFTMWFGHLALRFEGEGLVVRAAICLLAIVPSGVLLGFGFPTGMRLVTAIDRRPTPWFWGINGAAGVLAAGLAVAINIQVSIGASLLLGALSYALIVPIALRLLAIGTTSSTLLSPMRPT